MEQVGQLPAPGGTDRPRHRHHQVAPPAHAHRRPHGSAHGAASASASARADFHSLGISPPEEPQRTPAPATSAPRQHAACARPAGGGHAPGERLHARGQSGLEGGCPLLTAKILPRAVGRAPLSVPLAWPQAAKWRGGRSSWTQARHIGVRRARVRVEKFFSNNT